MKRIIAILLASLCVMSFASCGDNNTAFDGKTNYSEEEKETEPFDAGLSIPEWNSRKDTEYRFYSDGNIEFLLYGANNATLTSNSVDNDYDAEAYKDHFVHIDSSSAVVVSSGNTELKTYINEDNEPVTLECRLIKVKMTVNGHTDSVLSGVIISADPILYLGNDYESKNTLTPAKAVIKENGEFVITAVYEGYAVIGGNNPYYSIDRFGFDLK